ESDLRLRLPDRDLCSRSEAGLRVLRPAVPDGGPIRRPRRSQGGQENVDADRARSLYRGRTRFPRGRASPRRGASVDGDVAAARVVCDWTKRQPVAAAEARAAI